jgi:hypothetical protein
MKLQTFRVSARNEFEVIKKLNFKVEIKLHIKLLNFQNQEKKFQKNTS